jgi:hypothetical protein
MAKAQQARLLQHRLLSVRRSTSAFCYLYSHRNHMADEQGW